MTELGELRRAMRSLAQRPWFFIAAVSSLALGVGANVTVFTIVNALLFRPLPYHEPDRLAFVRAENSRLGVTRGGVTLAELEAIRARVPSLRGAGVVREGDFNLTVGERARRIRGAVVSASVLGTLGVPPVRGGGFTPDDDRPGAPHRVVVSDALWQSVVSPMSRIDQATLRIDGVPFQIAGVMPAGFRFPEQADFWFPVGSGTTSTTGAPEPNARVYQLIARLAPGASLRTVAGELAGVARAVDEERPANDRGWVLTAIAAQAERGENARPAVYLLLALVTCVLLIACSNLASLLTVRAALRRRESAIRSALGASQARLVWHGLAESIVLAVAGGLLSLGVASAGVKAVRVAFPPDTLPFWLHFAIDWRVLIYALGIGLLTTLAFGLIPALWSARRAPASGLMAGSRSATDGTSRGRVGAAVVAAQVAVSLMLVVAASLLGSALRSMRSADLGYEPRGLVTTDVEPRGRRYAADDARGAFYLTLRESLNALPGVRAATGFDLWGGAAVDLAGPAGGSSGRIETTIYAVLPTYFETMRIRIRGGRGVGAADVAGAPPVAVVNETFARRSWPNESPIGQRLRVATASRDAAWITVVGVVADVRRNPADLEREAHVYIAAVQFPPRRMELVVRADGAPLSSDAFERAARNADPDEPLGPIVTMQQRIGVWTAPSRFFALALMGFAIVAMIIAAVGVYGLVSGGVTSRTREFGIRLALGATSSSVVGIAIRRGARLSGIGAGLGLIGAVAVSKFLVTLPFGVERVDPIAVALAALALVAISLIAAYVPSRRASRVEPTIALSNDA